MDTKNDIKSLMTSLTAILDTKSWSDNQNEVLYAALEEYETARQDCMPKEAVQHKHLEKEVLSLLDTLMAGKINKAAAVVIQAAILAGVILKPTYSRFCKRYGKNVIGKTIYGRYIGAEKEVLLKEDLEPLIIEFKKIKN